MTGKWLDRAAIGLLIVLWCCTVYRAKTQSISIDEAYTYDQFVSKSFEDMINGDYNANNHVLYTILAQVSVERFGLSEFSLRIPALLGGLIFFAALFLLSRVVFPVPWIRFLIICLVSLNPLVLDFLCIARGYGLANGLFLLAVFLTMRGRMWMAGISLGLAAGANLTIVFPGIALITVTAFGLLRERKWKPLLSLVLPGVAVAALILAVPLSYGDPSSFYFGADSMAQSLKSLLGLTLYREHSPLREWGRSFATVMIPVMVLLILAIARWALNSLICGVFVTSLFGLFLAHLLFGVLYPYGRTGLYLVILFTFSCGVALQSYPRIGLAIAAPVLALFLVQTNFRMYGEWPFDENFAGLIDRLVEQHATHPQAKVRVGVNQLYGFQLGYYVKTRRLDWIQRTDFGFTDKQYDYYLLKPEDMPLIRERKLNILYADPHSYGMLAGN